MKETMNLHKALSELKILNSRISDKISDCIFYGTIKSNSATICSKTVEDFCIDAFGNYDSVNVALNEPQG